VAGKTIFLHGCDFQRHFRNAAIAHSSVESS
jgi:hypothetical protein